jgi:hypothetical protein
MQTNLDKHLERVIRRTIMDAKLSGKDYPTQNEVAAHTVRRIRPDMTASEALTAVDFARRDEIEDA